QSPHDLPVMALELAGDPGRAVGLRDGEASVEPAPVVDAHVEAVVRQRVVATRRNRGVKPVEGDHLAGWLSGLEGVLVVELGVELDPGVVDAVADRPAVELLEYGPGRARHRQ